MENTKNTLFMIPKCKNYLTLFFSFILVFLYCSKSSAQFGSFPQATYADSLPAIFDEYLEDNQLGMIREGYTLDSEQVKRMAPLFTYRFKKGLFVSQKSVLSAIRLIPDYKDKVKLIDTVLNLIYEQPSLKAFLIKERIFYTINTPERLSADSLQSVVSLYNKYIPLIDSLTLIRNWTKSEAHLTIADLIYKSDGDPDLIEKHYYDSMKYPYFNVSDKNYLSEFFDNYIEAILGIIENRRGDLEKLLNIRYVPAVHSRVAPLLKMYIEELGGTFEDKTFIGPNKNNKN
ncbi:MAG: hypothetical protein AAF990_22235 [Bacteroidota bacterium]